MMIGENINGYHIVEKLGEGGMADVYKAIDLNLDRDVAVKFLRVDTKDAAKNIKRFEREAKALAKLRHPNMVSVINYGNYKDQPYLVMDFVPGGTLKSQLGKPIPWEKAAKWLAPIARALDYAHKRNIIHRDVKPSNILVGENGELLLSDFGVAKILGDEETVDLTQSGVGVGTPHYMSPEQGRNKNVGPRSDIYSLGIVLYEMITGKRPYEADTPLAVVLKHIEDPLPSPRKYLSGVSRSAETIISIALAKNPNSRYKSMGDMASALEKAASRVTSINLPSKKSWLAIGISIVLLGILYGGYSVWPIIRTQGIRQSSESFSSTPPDDAKIESSPSSLSEITETPTVPTVSEALTPDHLAISEANVDQIANLHSLSGHDDAVWSVAFSPDSELVATGSRDRTIRIWHSDTGVLINTIEAHDFGVSSVTFSPAGEAMASGSGDWTIKLWRMPYGTLLLELNEHTAIVDFLAFNTTGTLLASASEDRTVRIWQANDGTLLHTLVGHSDSVWTVAFSPDGHILASGSVDESIKLWDVSDGTLYQTWNTPTARVVSLCFSPDGSILAAGLGDNTIQLLRVSDGSVISTLKGHKDGVSSVAFSPDGSILVSGSWDMTARLWRVADGTLLRVLEGHIGFISSVAFSSNGRYIATGSHDLATKIWGLP